MKNVKGDESFTEGTGGSLTWQADGKDIYYQGTTEKELPVDMKITYTLDGKEISPEELAGKSGRVTIRMDYANKEKRQGTIDGKTEEVYVPFTAISGMILSDKFSNVEVKNGKLVSDGKNQIVAGVAMPGLKESLKLEKADFDTEMEIPDYVEVSADVEDFSLDMTVTVLMSDLLSDLKLSDDLDLSGITEAIDSLDDASRQLVEGSGELAEGTDTLKSSMKTYASGVDTLKEGVNSYTQGARTLVDGITSLKNGTASLNDGAGMLVSAVAAISQSFQGENGLMSGAAVLAAGIDRLSAALNTAMTDAEKQQIAAQADATVKNSFDGGMRDAIAAQAAGQFESTMRDGKDALGKQLCESELYGTMVEAIYQQKIFEAYQQQKRLVDAAIEQYAQAGVTMTIAQVVETVYQQQTGRTILSEVKAAVAEQLTEKVAPEILKGIAETGSQAMGVNVAKACEDAASQAARSAAVAGAEGTKKQIAAQVDGSGMAAGANALSAGINKLYGEGISPLKNGVDSMAAQLPTLADGIRQLMDGGTALVANNDALNNGAATLAGATGQLVDGVDKLDAGAKTLADGMAKFDEEGIRKLTEFYRGDVQALLDRLDAVRNAGRSYHTFTKLPDGMEGSVKFIIRTEAVKKE